MDIQIGRFAEREPTNFGDLNYCTYFETSRIGFGIANIPAGGIGDVDPGHEDAEEVIAVNSGKIVVIFPDSDQRYHLGPGDAILVPPGVPHVVENQGTEDAVFTYSAAPHL